MQLAKIRIKNYRLLVDAELEVDPKTTLIVKETILPKPRASSVSVKYWMELSFLSMITRCSKGKIYILILLRSWQRKSLLKISVNGWNQYL